MNTTPKHALTERQKVQLAEVEAAKTKSDSVDSTTDTNLGGSDSNSGPPKPSAPTSGGTAAGSGSTTTTASGSSTTR